MNEWMNDWWNLKCYFFFWRKGLSSIFFFGGESFFFVFIFVIRVDFIFGVGYWFKGSDSFYKVVSGFLFIFFGN